MSNVELDDASAEASAVEMPEEPESVNNLADTAAALPPAAMTHEPRSEARDDRNVSSTGVKGEEPAPVVSYVKDGAGDGARPKRHRVREAAREAVEENLLPRVEKLRQASNVVLDEAAYDPSLRFILIALALFLIFLVLLLVSRILG